tara:strand:+ start:441 stop:683 length:243 start_codon:yes stop_codon:yes gene_type:complete
MSYYKIKNWMKNVLEFPMEKTNYKGCKIKKIGKGSEKGLTKYTCTYGKKKYPIEVFCYQELEEFIDMLASQESRKNNVNL